jgi:bifunctional non-homologous end joining protein LigD
VYAGRVGTGFSDKVLANLYAKFQKLKTPSCPFVNLPEKTPGRWGLGITSAVMKRCQWLKPVLVAQVKFTEWTSTSSAGLPGTANRQTGSGGRPRINRDLSQKF